MRVLSAQRLIDFALALAFVAFGGVATSSHAQRLDHVPGELLVKFRAGTSELEQNRAASTRGGTIAATQVLLGYVKVRLDDPLGVDAAVDLFRSDPKVVWAEPNGFYHAAVCPTCPQDPYLVDLPDALPENQWGVFKTGIPSLWRHGGGGAASVAVAIVDTGIDDFVSPHPDLAANVTGGHDFVDDDANPTDSGSGASLYGHGTHVAGIAAGASNTVGIAGVAHCSSILVVRVLDCTAGTDCPGTFADIADGIQWAADNGGDVINLSLAGDTPSSAVRTAIQYAIARGSIVVAASGNDSDSSLRWPARFPETIAVGATTSSDDVASFSNYGPELDVVAPGVGIWSTYTGPAYHSTDGTSMAAPFVSGLAALALAKNPAMRQGEMEQYLRDHALPLGGANGEKDGYGRVDFPKLEDWSDAPAVYPAASHGLFFWERLGAEASAERSLTDPSDGDFRFNQGGAHDTDGYDDGPFPESWGNLPYLPPHVTGGPPSTLDLGMTVCRFNGPRYGAAPSKQLHLDVWADWDSDHAWEGGAAGEYIIADHTEDPTTWGSNGLITSLPFTPVDEHLLGNPVVVRSRLGYGAGASSPSAAAPFGEVEDDVFVNYVEDFDISQRVHSPGVNASLGGWGLISDPMPDGACVHHGDWEFAIAQHPSGPPCNGAFETTTVLSTPVMDWGEYTAAKIRFWYCHRIFNECSLTADFCRVRIVTESGSETLGPIPIGTGTVEFDISHHVNKHAVFFEFIEETDWPGAVVIDDITIWAFDGERSIAIPDLALARVAGSAQVDLSWTNQRENEYILSPPAEPQANINDFRYSPNPIVTEADFVGATPFTPIDRVAGSPLPGAPGAVGGVSFKVPSAFEGYFVATRTQDEVVNKAVSNSPGDPGDSTSAVLGVEVLSQNDDAGAPGDTVTLSFQVTNTGNASDSYALTAMDTKGWVLSPNPTFMALAAGASDTFGLDVMIAGGAVDGDIDTVGVTATSFVDGSVSHTDSGEVQVYDPASTPETPQIPLTASLTVIGQNPFRDALPLELALPRAGWTTLWIYDNSGRRVRGMINGPLPAGKHTLVWDGRDDGGREVASGAYLLEARACGDHWRTKILRIR